MLLGNFGEGVRYPVHEVAVVGGQPVRGQDQLLICADTLGDGTVAFVVLDVPLGMAACPGAAPGVEKAILEPAAQVDRFLDVRQDGHTFRLESFDVSLAREAAQLPER